MIALLKKDWRINRGPIIGMAVSLAVLCLFAAFISLDDISHGDGRTAALRAMNSNAARALQKRDIDDEAANRVRWLVEGAIQYGMRSVVEVATWLAAVFSAAYGGVAFAMERRESWSDFLAMASISRSRIVASKLIVALSCLLGGFGFIMAMHYVAYGLFYSTDEFRGDFVNSVCPIAAIGILAFGVAWLSSVFLASPAIAACLSMGFAGFTIVSIFDIGIKYHAPNVELWQWIAGYSIFTGITALTGGTIYYLKRFEP